MPRFQPKHYFASLPDLDVIGVAYNGQEAIDLAKLLSPDVLLMDIQMPEMTGLEAAFHLQNILPNIKILILSTFKNQDYLTQALSLGVKGYILKNTPSDELAQAIRLAHRGHSHFSPGIMEQLVPLLNHNDALPRNKSEFARKSLNSSNAYFNNYQNTQDLSTLIADQIPVKALAKSEADSLKFENLTRRETEIIKLIAQGYANREIANALNISEQTVKNHVSSILRRLNLRDRTQVALWATKMFVP
jgi:DNA-binding NarL/FixJ family response regulator